MAVASLTSRVPGVEEFMDVIENGVTSVDRGRKPCHSSSFGLVGVRSIGDTALGTTSTAGYSRGLSCGTCCTGCVCRTVEVNEAVRDAFLLVGADREELLAGTTGGGAGCFRSGGFDGIKSSSGVDIMRCLRGVTSK